MTQPNTTNIPNTQTNVKPLLPNLDDTRKQLDIFGNPEGIYCWQYYPDNKSATQSNHFSSTFTEAEPRLTALNQTGHSICINIQETDGKGRKEENITSLRFLVLD